MKLSLILKLTLGFLALGLGAVGLLLPVWPTTPFVLAALACFSSAPGVRAKILHIRFFREYYESYTEGKGLRRGTVTVSFVFLWGMLLLSTIMLQSLLIGGILLAVGAAVTLHLLWIARPNDKKQRIILAGKKGMVSEGAEDA